ncbi:hypothetical protein ccbrp13_52740 [Ktedonobacteria bacterium brp13]|nr:hypothetical protein ccbrp13_52740 [Ktedonobacteria bacterium brp13]
MGSNENHTPLAPLPTNRNPQPTMGNHQLVIFTQLLRIAMNIQHIDELLIWLGHTFVQRLELEAIQFWTQQAYSNGQTSVELRAVVCRNPSLPQQIVINSHVAEIAECTLNERHGVMPQATEAVFSPLAAQLLTHNHLNFWSSYFLNNQSLIPPMNNDATSEQIPTPVNMLIALFTAQNPVPRLIPTLGNIMEQTITLARKRNLLYPAELHPASIQLPSPPPKRNTPSLMELVPLKTPENEESNGNAAHTSSTISNRQARRLYLAVDGHRSLSDLSTLTQLNTGALSQALRTLLIQGHIQLREPGGQAVASAHVLAAL